MMFGTTLGGNGTILGASSNIVAAGICKQNGRPVAFFELLRFDIPVMLSQLLVSGAYLLVRLADKDRKSAEIRLLPR